MRVLQIGNQGSPFSTEAAYRDGYQAAGCDVVGVEQSDPNLRALVRNGFDLVVYSRTHNNLALTPHWRHVWRELEEQGCQTAGVHADAFVGIPERERWVAEGDPQFTVGTLFTADGADLFWTEAGVNHVWLPPGADTRFTDLTPGAPVNHAYDGKIVFVGSRGYHPEWPHRPQMIEYLERTYGDRFIWVGNGSGRGVIRGPELDAIYAADCVVVGDHFGADRKANYCSDRIPYTLSAGGLLLNTESPGLADLWCHGLDLFWWQAYDWDGLTGLIDYVSAWSPADRAEVKHQGQQTVLGRDTIRHRARTVLETLALIPDKAQTVL